MAFFDVPKSEDLISEARQWLDDLRCLRGVDEPVRDDFCANPAVLPLPDRERLFVKDVLQLATDPTQLEPRDFREMEAQSLSQRTFRR